MKLNWRDSFKEESNNTLFEIFSVRNRINIDPQIFAGNILFERKYKLELLEKAKNELIESIEDAFKRKYNTEPKKIIKENIIREIFLRTLVALVVFGIFINSNDLSFSISSMTVDNKIMAIILGIISFLPLL